MTASMRDCVARALPPAKVWAIPDHKEGPLEVNRSCGDSRHRLSGSEAPVLLDTFAGGSARATLNLPRLLRHHFQLELLRPPQHRQRATHT
jgi:hypothetical protein